MGTACDGVVHSNASAIQLHPIGLRFGLDAEGQERKEGWEEGGHCNTKSFYEPLKWTEVAGVSDGLNEFRPSLDM